MKPLRFFTDKTISRPYSWPRILLTVLMITALLTICGCQAPGVAGTAVDVMTDSSAEESAEMLITTGYDNVAESPAGGYLWLVDEEHLLSPGYVPENLTEAGDGIYAAREAAEGWLSMLRGMQFDGVDATGLSLVSGYRSYDEQSADIEPRKQEYLAESYTEEKAARFALYDYGQPGADPRQTGMILEAVMSDGSDLAASKPGEWLRKNAEAYGFAVQWTDSGITMRYVTAVHAIAMRTLETDVAGYLQYLDASRSYVVEMDGAMYRIRITEGIDPKMGPILFACGDNRGNTIVVTPEG